MSMRTLKLRGAARYTIMTVGKEPILRNGTADVDEATAKSLLKQVVFDRANTAWPVWEDVTPEGAAEVDKQVTKKPRRTRRRKTEQAEDTLTA